MCFGGLKGSLPQFFLVEKNRVSQDWKWGFPAVRWLEFLGLVACSSNVGFLG